MERVRYKKPNSFNNVSLFLILATGLGVYLIIYLWPVFNESSRVKSILLDQIPMLYRANLLPNETAIPMIEKIKESINGQLTKIKIDPKRVKLTIERNAKEISIEARFKTKAHFPFPDRTFEFEVSPKAISDAERVDW
jgi:hypothetical protein